jgi:hypothetical protein
MEWKPIETAPKDGSTILVWGKYMIHPSPAEWNMNRKEWRAVWDGSRVIESQGDTWIDYAEPSGVSHWMPLPKPPASTAE